MRANRFLSALPALALAVLPVAACQAPSDTRPATEAGEEAPAPETTEAERTRLMEEKAAGAQRDLEDAKAGGLSEQEAEEAVRKYEQEMRELRELAEGEAPAEEPEPPPE